MALNNLFQCLRPSLTSRSDETKETRSPTISAPFNIRTIHNNSSHSLEDSPTVTTTPLRHKTGPGIQFTSDLHYERFLNKTTNLYTIPPTLEIPQRAAYMILAGDIGRFVDTNALQHTLQHLCSRFEKVLYVPGNHEIYGTSREEGLHIASNLSKTLSEKRFIFMNRTRVDLSSNSEKITVLGCTLHSLIPPTSPLTNDFARIGNWTVAQHNSEHQRDLQWLQDTLASIAEEASRRPDTDRPDTRVRTATHFSLSFTQKAHPRFQNSDSRYCFSSNTLEQFAGWDAAERVSHWTFGHTHYNTVFSHGETIVVSNQPNDGDCLRKFDWGATI